MKRNEFSEGMIDLKFEMGNSHKFDLTLPICFLWGNNLQDIHTSSSMACLQNDIRIYSYFISQSKVFGYSEVPIFIFDKSDLTDSNASR